MSQMVLPQTSPQGPPSDKGVKSGSGAGEKSGDSHFDTVSRAEQQRFDNRHAEKRDQARADESARNEQARQAENKDRRPDEPGQDSTVTEASGKSEDKGEGAEDAISQQNMNETLPEEVIPLTFAGLQSLLAPAGSGTKPLNTGNSSGQVGGSGVMPGMQAFAGIMSGLPGAAGVKPGQVAGQSGGPGLALTEALMSGVADSSRTQETPSVQGAIRFQAAAELASQQAASPNSPRLPAEAAALRGYSTSIDVPVNHAEWGDKLVGKLTWLTARNMSVAEIHLTPPDMGPMEVRVQVQQEQANITVHSANPAVRDQLELHSHRLRDMLSEQGLSLEQFDVSDSPQQQTGEEGEGEAGGNGAGALAGNDQEDQDPSLAALDLTWKGEVDIFA
ncbi:flagellar hook-length control protein FliK [Marinobacter vulgaris]|uniref:Flagellar hook-length control protein FliK n=1 Tax=Marinobacter vulgaris TaxID=1928331 RepID=A0A2V3ZJC2_9GAMM|nr:flagellar hook-length control protein FliK [Marinobacter vulgaris]PXX91022.1 flagellar hook-length control protein FliK [Marinobacter vulgaris]TSJ69995.1 flagellar hook-length control protein FliK [Marinobacter vulgaris]